MTPFPLPNPFLASGGECGAILRAIDWSASPLGAVARWPQPLCTVVGLMLNSKFPMFVAWGAELILLYNDAYAEILGSKHPAAAGSRLDEVWREIWPDIAPIAAQALGGTATFHHNAHFKVHRNGGEQDAWFMFSYSPILGDNNAIGGMFCAVSETTEQVLASRHKLEENARLHQLFEQLQLAQGELKAAYTRKDEFLAMLAHELRNPLAPIASAAELLARAPGNPQIVQKSSAVIARQVGHMKELLDDLLDVSRVTRGLVTLRTEAVHLQAILRDALDQANVQILKKAQHLRLDVPGQACTLVADKTRLIQIFANLLNNASKFTPDEGTISLTLTFRPGVVAIVIADSGVGISPELLPHIFDLFTQGERSSDRIQGGLGLGLSLVKHLVELHGGNVSAHSAGAGLGSSFTVELPLAPAAHPAPPADATDVAAVTDAADAAAPLQYGLNILVVDDNTDAAETMGLLLETVGHRVTLAHSAAEALATAARRAPSMLFLDIGLPLMDGYELVRQLRRLPQTSTSCMVAVTGYGQRDDVTRALAAGFDAHLVKPVSLSSVLAVLEQAMARAAPAAAARPD